MVKGLAKGSAAEYLLVDGEACARKPPNVSFDHAASVSLVAATAVLAFRTCGLQEIGASRRDGPRVLITRGSGGVGTCAIQLAKEMFGASFVATTASGAKAETCRDLGADWVVDFRVESVAAALTSDEEAQRFDAIIDCSGEAAALAAAPLLRRGGALCSISAAPTKEAVREWIRAMVPVAARHEARPGEEPRLQRVPCQPWCVPRPGGHFAHQLVGHRCRDRHHHWRRRLSEQMRSARSVLPSCDCIGRRRNHVQDCRYAASNAATHPSELVPLCEDMSYLRRFGESASLEARS